MNRLSETMHRIIERTASLLALLTLALAGSALYAATDTATQSVTMTVNEIAVIDVTGNPGTLTILAPGTGGATPANATDNSTYAQYTSVVASALTRKITANFGGSDATPAGTSLKLTVAPSGGEGTSAGQKTLTSTAQDVVTAIGSAATGTGGTSGAQLTYELSVDTFASLVAGESKTVTVTLTMTDDA